ncbi:MAG: hypothetical protein M1820_004160 [Bogoriella megaspora]|nr:MAG: hypothetical protein M1820_004160 [Bogoriella megaspora]
MATQGDFDPFSQAVTLLMTDGTPWNITLPEIQDFISYSAQVSIVWGSQIGATLMVLLILLLSTKAEKRQSPVFITNTVALVLNFIRCVLCSLYCAGPWYNFYAQLTGDFENVPNSQFAISVAGAVFTFLVVVCIEISLITQAYVVCVTATRAQRFWIMVVSMTVALLALGFVCGNMVLNAKSIMSTVIGPYDDMIASASNITLTISICYFCLIFIFKLGYAILERRKLGLKQFGPMQIIVIMSSQTLIVPVIFAGIQYRPNLIPLSYSLVPTIVALFLPLSSLWAAASIDGSNANSGPNRHGFARKNSGSTGRTALIKAFKFGSNKSTSTDKTVSFSSPQSSPGLKRDQDIDLEKQERSKYKDEYELDS